MIHKLTLSEFFGLIGDSINFGKRFFLVLFLGGMISVGIDLGLNFSGFGSFLSGIFTFFWIAGIIYVSQTIVVHDKVPTLAQYFVAFQKSHVLKRLVPAMIGYFILSMGFAIALGILGIVVYTMIQSGGSAESLTPDEASDKTERLLLMSQNLALATSLITILMVVLALPITLFTYVLLLRNLPWKEAWKLAFQGFKSNFGIFLLYLAPTLLNLISLGILPMIMTPEFAQEIQSKDLINKSRMGQQIFSIVWIPFLTTLMYLMYKRIFRFPQPDNEIALMN